MSMGRPMTGSSFLDTGLNGSTQCLGLSLKGEEQPNLKDSPAKRSMNHRGLELKRGTGDEKRENYSAFHLSPFRCLRSKRGVTVSPNHSATMGRRLHITDLT